MFKNILILFLLLNFCGYSIAQVDNTDVLIGGSSSNAESENSVFISPLTTTPTTMNVLNANNRMDLPFIQCGISACDVDAFMSTTGGSSWSTPFTLPNSYADPAAAIGRSGRYFVGHLDDNNAVKLSYSDDNGVTWSQVTIATTNLDKDHLWIDNKVYKKDGTSNPYQGYLYEAWTKFVSTPSYLFFSRSTNGSTGTPTWSTPVNISAGTNSLFMDQGVNLQTGPNGEVYACWAVYDFWGNSSEGAIGFNSSSDGGVTWGTAYRAINNIKGIRATAGGVLGGGKSMETNSFPSMTVNQQNGNMFIVWTNQGVPCGSNNPPGCNTGDADIYMIRMINGQGVWSAPIRVSQDPIGNGKDQWSPWIACDEASGALVCAYYDSRDFTNNDSANTYVSISYDQGDTWADYSISDVPWNADGGSGIGNYAGHYIGVDAYHGYVVPVWTDTRSGDLAAYTNPFEIPCPQDLNLANGDYAITDEVTFPPDANYKVTGSIMVAGGGSTYKVHQGAEVLMEAGEEIVLNDGFEALGEFQAIPNPLCTSFSEKRGSNDASSSSEPPQLAGNTVDIVPDMPAQLLAGEKFNVFPNPSSNGKYILTGIHKFYENPHTLLIYNSLGELIHKKDIYRPTPFEFTAFIDISKQPEGVYYIKIINETTEVWKKPIIR